MVVQIRKTPPPRITAWASLSAPMRLVGTEGVEPSRIAPQVPKTCASAISPRPRGRSHCSIAAGGLQASRRFPNAGLRAKSLFEKGGLEERSPSKNLFPGRSRRHSWPQPAKAGDFGGSQPSPEPAFHTASTIVARRGTTTWRGNLPGSRPPDPTNDRLDTAPKRYIIVTRLYL